MPFYSSNYSWKNCPQSQIWTVTRWKPNQFADSTQQSNVISSCILAESHLPWWALTICLFHCILISFCHRNCSLPGVYTVLLKWNSQSNITDKHRQKSKEKNQGVGGYITWLLHDYETKRVVQCSQMCFDIFASVCFKRLVLGPGKDSWPLLAVVIWSIKVWMKSGQVSLKLFPFSVERSRNDHCCHSNLLRTSVIMVPFDSEGLISQPGFWLVWILSPVVKMT